MTESSNKNFKDVQASKSGFWIPIREIETYWTDAEKSLCQFLQKISKKNKKEIIVVESVMT